MKNDKNPKISHFAALQNFAGVAKFRNLCKISRVLCFQSAAVLLLVSDLQL